MPRSMPITFAISSLSFKRTVGTPSQGIPLTVPRLGWFRSIGCCHAGYIRTAFSDCKAGKPLVLRKKMRNSQQNKLRARANHRPAQSGAAQAPFIKHLLPHDDVEQLSSLAAGRGGLRHPHHRVEQALQEPRPAARDPPEPHPAEPCHHRGRDTDGNPDSPDWAHLRVAPSAHRRGHGSLAPRPAPHWADNWAERPAAAVNCCRITLCRSPLHRLARHGLRLRRIILLKWRRCRGIARLPLNRNVFRRRIGCRREIIP